MGGRRGLVILGGLLGGVGTAVLLIVVLSALAVRIMTVSGKKPQRWHPVTPTPTRVASPTPLAHSPTPEHTGLHPGGRAVVVARVGVRMRKSPGYKGKASTDVVVVVPPHSVLEVTGGPSKKDGLIWWQVRYRGLNGWMAEATANGIRLLAPAEP